MRSAPSLRALHPAAILLVDDNRHGIVARRNVLQELGYSVTTAASGEAALALFDQQAFDLVVTDYRMPAMDGVAFIAALRGRGLAIPVVLLSGFVEPLGLSAANTGADLVLQKSSSEMAHLVRGVKRLLAAPKKPPAPEARSRSARTKSSGG